MHAAFRVKIAEMHSSSQTSKNCLPPKVPTLGHTNFFVSCFLSIYKSRLLVLCAHSTHGGMLFQVPISRAAPFDQVPNPPHADRSPTPVSKEYMLKPPARLPWVLRSEHDGIRFARGNLWKLKVKSGTLRPSPPKNERMRAGTTWRETGGHTPFPIWG